MTLEVTNRSSVDHVISNHVDVDVLEILMKMFISFFPPKCLYIIRWTKYNQYKEGGNEIVIIKIIKKQKHKIKINKKENSACAEPS